MVTSSRKGGNRNRISSASRSFLRQLGLGLFATLAPASTSRYVATLSPITSKMPKASKGQYSPRVSSNIHAS